MAGMGKSTIARTVASEFSEARYLGASFFFSRGGGDLGNSQKFVTTIALQLARSFPFIKSHIGDAITRNENITCQGGLRNQWKELILGPLSQLTSHQNLRISLVVDALDECAHEQDVEIILRLFAEAKDLTAVNLRSLSQADQRPQFVWAFEICLRTFTKIYPFRTYHDRLLKKILLFTSKERTPAYITVAR